MSTSSEELQDQVQELRKDFEVQTATNGGVQTTHAATQAGAHATQTAMHAGQMSTMAAAHAGTIATVAAGCVSLVVGMFLGLTIANSRH